MARDPVVSVVIPAYDGERFVGDAIESALGQTMADIEVIVVDDGSPDGTAGLLDRYAARDERVVAVSQENRGVSAARNRGIGMARGVYVAMLDQDDVFPPERLELQCAFLQRNPSVGAVGGAVTFVDEGGRPFVQAVRYPLTDAEIRAALEGPADVLQTTPFIHSAVLVRKGVFQAVAGYRSAFEPAEDLDLWVRISERFALANLRQTTVHYRVHAAQVSLHRLEQQALSTVASRLSGRARREGRPDPFADAEQITPETVLALGATADDIAASFVNVALWLARTNARAGYASAAAKLLSEAEQQARRVMSADVLAEVDRVRAGIAAGRPSVARRVGRSLRSLLPRTD